jgi:nucleotide-binding universal stress UspA family protein
MFKRILVALDGSEGSLKALRAGIELAAYCGAELHSISIEEDLPQYVATVGEFEEVKEKKDAFFEKINTEAIALAKSRGVELTPHVMAGHEVQGIVEFCADGGFDMLVVGFMGHSRIFERVWGSTSQTLTRLAPCSVLVAK